MQIQAARQNQKPGRINTEPVKRKEINLLKILSTKINPNYFYDSPES